MEPHAEQVNACRGLIGKHALACRLIVVDCHMHKKYYIDLTSLGYM